jgi:hypothetical protein
MASRTSGVRSALALVSSSTASNTALRIRGSQNAAMRQASAEAVPAGHRCLN